MQNPILMQRLFPRPGLKEHYQLCATQAMQALPAGPLHMESGEVLRFTLIGPYKLTVKGGLTITHTWQTRHGHEVVEVRTGEKSYGGFLQFTSTDGAVASKSVDVFVHPREAAYIVKISGFGVRERDVSLGRVHLCRVVGYENADLFQPGAMIAKYESIEISEYVVPFDCYGWTVLVTAGPYPRLLKIVSDQY